MPRVPLCLSVPCGFGNTSHQPITLSSARATNWGAPAAMLSSTNFLTWWCGGASIMARYFSSRATLSSASRKPPMCCSAMGTTTVIGYSLRSGGAHRPGAGDERDGSVLPDWKARADALSKRAAALFDQRHAIGRRRALAAEERGPVIVEVAKARRHVDDAHLDFRQPGVGK